MEEKAVTIRGDREIALYDMETRFAMAVKQRELLENYIRERLKPDKHFYTVGEGDDSKRKPSLTKEGAELICLPHNLKPKYEIISGLENPPMDDSPYQIAVRCELCRGDSSFEGQGVGSASSMVTKKDGTRVQRQKDPGLRHNATIKMACKSAYIAATLNATAASEFFTQDLEDDQDGESKDKQTDSKEHWCPVHNTAFFKKGKMTSYAHPVEGEKEWCHEGKKSNPDIEKAEQGEKDKELWPDAPQAPKKVVETQPSNNPPTEEKVGQQRVGVILGGQTKIPIFEKNNLASLLNRPLRQEWPR